MLNADVTFSLVPTRWRFRPWLHIHRHWYDRGRTDACSVDWHMIFAWGPLAFEAGLF